MNVPDSAAGIGEAQEVYLVARVAFKANGA